MRAQLFGFNFNARDGAAECRSAGHTRSLARFFLLGALVFGVLPASATSLAQAPKPGAPSSAGVNESTPAPEIKRPQVINAKPFEDIALQGKALIDQGKLDLNNNAVELTVFAERNDDGTLKAETVKIDWVSAHDENLQMMAQQLVMSISQSKILGVFQAAKDVRIAFKLDQTNVSLKILSELASEGEAINIATGYAGLLSYARIAKKGTEEGELYNRLKFDNEGKLFTVFFEMPKEAAGKMITNMLAKKAAKDAASAQGRQ